MKNTSCTRKLHFIILVIVVWLCLMVFMYVYVNDLPESQQHPPRFHRNFNGRLQFHNEWRDDQNHHINAHAINKVITDDDPAEDDIMSVPRVYQYCNPPNSAVSGDEGEVPPEYNLEMVHVVIRHGDRSPIHMIKNQPPVKINCKLEQKKLIQNTDLQNFISEMKKNQKRYDGDDFKYWQLYPDEELCSGSQLTGIGAHQHLLNGKYLNFKFIEKWQLLTSNFSHDQIHVRCTEYSRTFQSAIAFLYGFLPKFDLKNLNIKKSFNMLFCDQFRGYTCFCQQATSVRQVADRFCGMYNRNSTQHKELMKTLAVIYSVTPSHLPWLAAIMDILMGQSCHGISLPCNNEGKCIKKNMLKNMWDVIDKEGIFCKSRNNAFNKYSHLIMHPLLAEIAQRMKSLINRKKYVPKFILYSGHDVTLSPLLIALGIHNGMWPSYASRIVIEFYSHFVTKKKIHYFIRILYNGIDMTKELSFCKGLVNGLCKFKHFMHFVDTHLQKYGVKNYNRFCFTD